MADDAAAGSAEDVVLYWRPGCMFCFALRRRLRAKGLELPEVDIWKDERAAARVRAVTGGDETVPTVVVGPARMVNPGAGEVLAAVREHAPRLLPPESQRPAGAGLRRWLARARRRS